ncbi:S-layer homology domain-containing protein [Clostridium aminobutyricum]|uniref:S-layer homology domain-containing protein n=1 Tax=Clostridium aminobutyricum TaxID=33953 RepID=A0A939DAC5_CLOAM|nr:S-layer homology domain-containing protein [Clostridium aminobutyricum]MBN7774081.1 S-layer homology domain-containing protein [Clostridium aminobutyricum]
MKKLLKIGSVILALMLMVTSTAFAATVPTDLEGATCKDAAIALIEAGAITGDTDGLFHPENNLTRAQACVILVKTIDPIASMVNGTATQSAVKTNFSDLSGYKWAAGYIGYAVEAGIVKGYPDGTFKPGEKVSTNEMLTMILRAAGYTEAQIGTTWPDDYIAKAKDVDIFKGIAEDYPVYATKGMAAQMTYNQIKQLKAMVPSVTETPQGTDSDKATSIPSAKGMTFTTGSFDSDMTNFSGTLVSKTVKIYTYGAKEDYNKEMTFSNKADDYRLDTLYKYNSAKTPAWYLVEDGKITSMILPRNVGFSGNAYGVINGTLTTVNVNNESVTGFETLTATKKITWFGKKGLSVPSLTNGDGQLYELHTSNGEVQSVHTNLTSYRGKVFNELTTSNTWTLVQDYGEEVITCADGKMIGVRSNASIYVWDDKKDEYRAGNLSSLKSGKFVRVYDVSDDDVTQADVVIVKE